MRSIGCIFTEGTVDPTIFCGVDPIDIRKLQRVSQFLSSNIRYGRGKLPEYNEVTMYRTENAVVKPYIEPSSVVPKVEHLLKTCSIPKVTERTDNMTAIIVTKPFTSVGAGVNVAYPL
jgi:hypothetical protein